MLNKTTITLTLSLLAIVLFTQCQRHTRETPNFCHHVYFWLNEPDNPQARATFEQGIARLLEVPDIQSFHFGIPAETAHREVVESSYTYSYLVFFKDQEGHDNYQQHPIHLTFVETCKHLWNKVVVYDAVPVGE